VDRQELAARVSEARDRTLSLVVDLHDDQWLGPKLDIVNPPLWEVGHVGWFQEYWVLRHAWGRPALRADGDRLYDSSRIPHDTRWDLPLPSRARTVEYLEQVRDAVLEGIARSAPTGRERYFLELAVFHEDMHNEAFLYTRQTLAYPAPRGLPASPSAQPGLLLPVEGDAHVPGGSFRLGSVEDGSFLFDNEKWAHPVQLEPFAIARTAVTQESFARFVEDGGYDRRELWSDEGWRWRSRTGARCPVYWRNEGGSWLRRQFDRWVVLEPDLPVAHVSWFEANAYCRWARRRLPTEAEWEAAASAGPGPAGGFDGTKRRYPWGDAPPGPDRANLDAAAGGTMSVHALAGGDSAFGCRQMIGNVWEWTDSDFGPYPGFSADPYEDYSKPWFGTQKVLRGGCWTTRSRLIRNAYRNFYTPDRRDVFAGFRTCALSTSGS
jgi:iron(II)-dependent oxidoreductase